MPRQPAFWSDPDHALSRLLAPVGTVVGHFAARRLAHAPSYRSSHPVICIGNLTAGGQGKTPLALAVAERLEARGFGPIFLSRGYGGRLKGPVRVRPTHTARDVGDEPRLLAEAAPCIVAADRVAGARLAETVVDEMGRLPILIMDDGFQNPSLAKTLSLIAVDAGFGLGNGLVLPAGPLRAPLSDQLARADALVVIGPGTAADGLVDEATQAALPVLHAALEPDATGLPRNRPIVAYAGIGRPEKFFATVRGLGLDLRQTVAFPDHHAFTASEASALLATARRENAQLLTTQKDKARLYGAAEGETVLGALEAASLALPVHLAVADDMVLEALLDAAGLQNRPDPATL